MRLTPLQVIGGASLDIFLGDPHWLPHPIRGLGWFINRSELMWRSVGLPLRASGALFTLSVVSVSTVLVGLTLPTFTVYWIFSLLACRSLDVESSAVVAALRNRDLHEARRRLSFIVGRDTDHLDKKEILRAVIETVAENLSDGVVAPFFYLAVAGPAGMAAYKAINTLDSMVGYRNDRYREFGWASARLDDIANFIPARLSAMLIWLCAPFAGGTSYGAIRSTLRDGGSQCRSLTGASVAPSHANFIHVRLAYSAALLKEHLLKQNILIRDCSVWPGVAGESIRIAVRTRRENTTLLDAWRTF